MNGTGFDDFSGSGTIPAPAVICAWCSGVIRDGALPASHGICPVCLAKQLAEVDALRGAFKESSTW